MASESKPDLSKPIMGSLEAGHLNRPLEEGQRLVFKFFLGDIATATAIRIEQIDLASEHNHLERFSGTDVSDAEQGEPGIAPGKAIAGVKDLKYAYVFLTEVDGEPVAQHEGYYADDSSRHPYDI
jgi:hypothetical protein